MIEKLKKEMSAAMSDSMKAKMDKMKARFGDGNLLSTSEAEARDIRQGRPFTSQQRVLRSLASSCATEVNASCSLAGDNEIDESIRPWWGVNKK